jgi:hypothetical protein
MDCIDCAARNGHADLASGSPLRNTPTHPKPRAHDNDRSLTDRRDSGGLQLIYVALMNPYPYPAASRIVRLTVFSKATSSDGINLNGPQIEQLQQLRSIEGVLAMDYDAMNHTGDDLPENVDTISLISTGSMTSACRLSWDGECHPRMLLMASATVVVLSYKFWQKDFFGDRAVLGTDIAQLRGFTVPCEDSFQSSYGRCLQCSRCRQDREPHILGRIARQADPSQK